jgi:hypothetical protein
MDASAGFPDKQTNVRFGRILLKNSLPHAA